MDKYLIDYVKLGGWTLAFIVGAPIWIPLWLIGYAVDKLIDKSAEAYHKQQEQE